MTKLIAPQIIVTGRHSGKGIEGDPYRIIEEWFSPDGTLILSYDVIKDDSWGAFNMIEYLRKIAKNT